MTSNTKRTRPLRRTIWTLAFSISLTSAVGAGLPSRIDVDCETGPGLERALAKAEELGEVDIYLHGICAGSFVIASDGVTLRAGAPGSGLAAAPGDPAVAPVLDVVDAKAGLRGIVVQGGVVGVWARGWDAEVFLYEVDVHEQQEVGVIAERGAQARLLDSTVRDALVGIVAQSDAVLNLQNVSVRNHESGIVVADRSVAAFTDTTIENNTQVGLNVVDRSDALVWGGALRDSGEVHVNANDWSSVRLLLDVQVGSETDATPYALGANRGSVIFSYSAPAIYGHVSAINRGSIRMGNTVLTGDLLVFEFSDALVRNSEITGIVACTDGSDAICRQTTAGGALDCPSPTCGLPAPEAVAPAPVVPTPPAIEAPRFEWLHRPGNGIERPDAESDTES